jgi:hypothetical protein
MEEIEFMTLEAERYKGKGLKSRKGKGNRSRRGK